MRLSEASRWIPKGAAKVVSKASESTVYLWGGKIGRPCALGYIGKAGRPAFNFSFKDEARRAEYVAGWLRDRDASAARKAAGLAERKAKLAKPHGLKVGDVLYGSWGYDQTNVEFWEVTKLVGKRMVEIRELCCESVETGFMSGNAVPLPGNYTSREPERRMVGADGEVKLMSWGCWLRKVEPIKVAGVAAGYSSASWTAYA